MKHVIDLSKYNIVTNFVAVKSLVDGVIIRCGYRGSTTGQITPDPVFEKYITTFSKLNTSVGTYFFTTAINTNESKEEADYVIDRLEQLKITPSFPIFIDTEWSKNTTVTVAGQQTLIHNGRSDGLSVSARTEIIKAFCDEIKSRGYIPGIYASNSWFGSMLNMNSLPKYPLWVARYGKTPTVLGYVGWQYTDKYPIVGISKPVDRSYWYIDINKSMSKIGDTDTNNTTKTTSIKAGQKLTLVKTPLYSSSTAVKITAYKTGIYYAWDNKIINGRLRITSNAFYIKNTAKITGWVNTKDVGL